MTTSLHFQQLNMLRSLTSISKSLLGSTQSTKRWLKKSQMELQL